MTNVFAFGNCSEGQLGIGTSNEFCLPASIEAFQNQQIKSIVSGLKHACVLTADGQVYSFGNNDYGQLGHQKRRTRPERVDALETFIIEQVACGAHHTLFLTKTGAIFCCGDNRRGQFAVAPTPELEHSYKPRLVNALANYKVIQVAAGGDFSVALTQAGDVFAWGDNSCGSLTVERFTGFVFLV